MKNINIMKSLILSMSVILGVSILSGCEKESHEKTSSYKLPVGLEDCKIYGLTNENGNYLTVVRCPLSATSTTYSNGKSTSTVSVVETAPEKVIKPAIKQKENNEIEVNGEIYRKVESVKEIKVNGETYKKIPQ